MPTENCPATVVTDDSLQSVAVAVSESATALATDSAEYTTYVNRDDLFARLYSRLHRILTKQQLQQNQQQGTMSRRNSVFMVHSMLLAELLIDKSDNGKQREATATTTTTTTTTTLRDDAADAANEHTDAVTMTTSAAPTDIGDFTATADAADATATEKRKLSSDTDDDKCRTVTSNTIVDSMDDNDSGGGDENDSEFCFSDLSLSNDAHWATVRLQCLCRGYLTRKRLHAKNGYVGQQQARSKVNTLRIDASHSIRHQRQLIKRQKNKITAQEQQIERITNENATLAMANDKAHAEIERLRSNLRNLADKQKRIAQLNASMSKVLRSNADGKVLGRASAAAKKKSTRREATSGVVSKKAAMQAKKHSSSSSSSYSFSLSSSSWPPPSDSSHSLPLSIAPLTEREPDELHNDVAIKSVHETKHCDTGNQRLTDMNRLKSCMVVLSPILPVVSMHNPINKVSKLDKPVKSSPKWSPKFLKKGSSRPSLKLPLKVTANMPLDAFVDKSDAPQQQEQQQQQAQHEHQETEVESFIPPTSYEVKRTASRYSINYRISSASNSSCSSSNNISNSNSCISIYNTVRSASTADSNKSKQPRRPRSSLPTDSVDMLKSWLSNKPVGYKLSKTDKMDLSKQVKLTTIQVANWFYGNNKRKSKEWVDILQAHKDSEKVQK